MRRTLILALLLVTAVIWTNVAPAGAGVAAMKDLPGCGFNTLLANDDDSTGAVGLPFTLNFFGTEYTSLYVNNNGNVTFDTFLSSFTPFDLTSTSRVIIAPFFGDVDTRAGGSALVTYGNATFGGRPAFCVNWDGVGYYDRRTDKLNEFQLLLVDRSDVAPGDFDIIFNYDQIQWETGDASGGTDGLGGSSARVGYSNGVDTALELPGSAVNGAFLDTSASGLVHNSRNSTIDGRYIFEVRGGQAPTGGFVSGQVLGDRGDGLNEPVQGAPVQICRQDVVPAQCSTTFTNADGEYNVAGLAAGTYNGIAVPPPTRPDLFPDVNELFDLANNQGRTGYDFKLLLPRPVPPGVTIDAIATTSGGSPVLNWSSPSQVTTVNEDCEGGSGMWSLLQAGEVLANGPMSATSTPDLFKGTIPPLRPEHGAAVLHIEMSCPGVGEDKVLDIDVYIDPSGTVRNSVNGEPVAGATVTLLRSDSATGPFEVVPDGSAVMSPSNRTNPDLTDAEGFFHWDVIAGYYKVRAEKDGCVSPDDPQQPFVETAILQIPPPALDLELLLDCGGEPATPTDTPAGPPATPTPLPGEIQFGDVNCDGFVNSIDAALMLQLIAGLLGSLACAEEADVNEDGNITSIDVALVLQHIAGFVPSLPV